MPRTSFGQSMLRWMVLVVLLGVPLRAEEGVAREETGLKFFETQVRPILQQNCFRCHGTQKQEGGLSLTSRAGVLKGGDSGPAVDLESPSTSLLLEAINWESFEMPPTGKMPPHDLRVLQRWVEQGLPMPAVVEVVEEGGVSPEVNDQTRAHWAFQKVSRLAVPSVKHDEWVSHPIDAFVAARLEAAGLSPAADASPEELIRRLHYDVLGLPPTMETVRAFVEEYTAAGPGVAGRASAKQREVFARWVDALLESPHYGEHWARYWLDLVRYAESNSFERDNPKPFVWRYRDYVIDALNDDKPYTDFIREQLAGDELPEVTRESIIATGYYRLGLWDDEPADPLLAFYDGLDDIAGTTAQAFLGLTMNCARCHEHKLDPIPHEDYYRFVAFFRNVRHYGVRSEESVYAASVRSIATPEEAEEFADQTREWEQEVARLRSKLDEVEVRIQPKLSGGEIDDFKRDSERERVLARHVDEWIPKEEFERYKQQRRRWNHLRNHPPRSAAQALCVKEHGVECPPTHVLLRGSPHSPGEEVSPGFPQVLGAADPVITPPDHGESSGRRLALAEWIASPENPLTARVMVNRLWQWHFGRGLVRSSNNFGLQGDLPTHPELLDWLAAEFVERGWSLKEMHRLMLNSSVYRMSSAAGEDVISADPVNDLFSRFNMRRLRAEEIRDSILAVSGTLTLGTMHGPSIYPEIPREVLAGQSIPGAGWGQSSPEEANRRSIYIHIKRSLQVPLLAAFDVPETDFTCPERFVSTQPTQALGMLNSAFLNEQAKKLADDVRKSSGEDVAAGVRMTLERVMQRPIEESEVEHGLLLIRDLQKDHGLSDQRAFESFCLLAFNLNEFLYLD